MKRNSIIWFIFALLSALFASVRRTNEKQLSHKLHHFSIGWTVQLLALPVIAALVLMTHSWINPLQLGWRFWVPTTALWIGFYPLNTYLYVNALKEGDLSKILPLQSLGPVFALLLGICLLGQLPSVMSVLAIIIIVSGLYVLNLTGSKLHNPLGMFTHDHANRLTVAMLLLVAFAGVLDAMAIRASNAAYYSLVSTAGAAISIYSTACIFGIRERQTIFKHRNSIATSAFFFAGSYSCYNLALSHGPLAYVSAARSSSIVMGAIIGFTCLKEPVTIARVAGLAIVCAGTALLGLNG